MHKLVDGSSDHASRPCEAERGQALYVEGLVALKNGDVETAACLLLQAVQCQPTHVGRRRYLVRALLIGERYQDVLAHARAGLDTAPDDADLHFAHGSALNALGRHAEACAALSRAIALQPDHAAAWLNLGNAEADLGDNQAAEVRYRAALRIDPTFAEAHASLGYILTVQCRVPEAIAACEAAIGLRPDFAQAHWNLAFATLLGGDLIRGFAEYEWRKRHSRYQQDFPPLSGQPWDGVLKQGARVLIRSEQGFGDTIQFARYFRLISEAGGKPVLVCPPPLVRLMQSLPGMEVISCTANPPEHDAWTDAASLPFLFRTTLQGIPFPDAYLKADPGRVLAWRSRLPGGRKVGVAFNGNPRHPADRRRSIALSQVGQLPDIPGLSFVDLHHGASAGRLGLPDLTQWMTDYAETAALIENLDLVITVDTSVAHLAGALGKPVWILLAHAPDWRWLQDRADSPWYRSVRLFRQPSPEDWSSVLSQVNQALTTF